MGWKNKFTLILHFTQGFVSLSYRLSVFVKWDRIGAGRVCNLLCLKMDGGTSKWMSRDFTK